MKSKFPATTAEFGIALAILASTAAPIFAQGGAAKNPATTPAAAHPDTVVVFPFQNIASDVSKDWLGEGLSELTTDSMVGALGRWFLRVTSVWQRWKNWVCRRIRDSAARR